MDSIMFFESSADKVKQEKVRTMNLTELHNYKKKLEEELVYLEDQLSTFLQKDKILYDEITEKIQKLSLEKDREMKKNLELIKERFQISKLKIDTTINRTMNRNAPTFKSVMCNALYSKIIVYEAHKVQNTNVASRYIIETKEAIKRTKQYICNLDKPILKIRVEEDEDFVPNPHRMSIQYTACDEDW
jgi:hypothetical protein